MDFETSERRDLRKILAVLRRRWPIIAISVVVCAGAAFAYSASRPKQYTGSASLLFRDSGLDQTLFGSTYFSNTDATRAAATNLQLVSLPLLYARTARAIGGGVSSARVSSEVQISQDGQSDVVTISASDRSPQLAARIPNEFANQYIIFRRDADRQKVSDAQHLVQAQLDALTPAERASNQGHDLQNRAEQLRILAALQTGNAERVQASGIPTSPSEPQPKREGLIGAAIGLLLGLGIVALLQRLDRRLHDPEEVAEIFNRPILGAVPESRAIASTALPYDQLAASESEAFRMLRANLRYFNVDHQIRSVIITSGAPGEGKSTIALNLASAAAASGTGRVLLIESDLRHPSLGRRLSLPASRGLSQLLAGDVTRLQDVAGTIDVGGSGMHFLDVVLSGPIPPNPTDLLDSHRMREVIKAAEERYDLVILDTPPTSVVPDAIPLINEVSGVIAVCRLNRTTRDAASHLKKQLEHLDANLLGVVVNAVGAQAGYYGYGYGYGYGVEEAKRRKRPPTSGETRSRRVQTNGARAVEGLTRNGAAASVPAGAREGGATTMEDGEMSQRAAGQTPEAPRREPRRSGPALRRHLSPNDGSDDPPNGR